MIPYWFWSLVWLAAVAILAAGCHVPSQVQTTLDSTPELVRSFDSPLSILPSPVPSSTPVAPSRPSATPTVPLVSWDALPTPPAWPPRPPLTVTAPPFSIAPRTVSQVGGTWLAINSQTLEVYSGRRAATWRWDAHGQQERTSTATADARAVYLLTLSQTSDHTRPITATLSALTVGDGHPIWQTGGIPISPTASDITLQLVGSAILLASSQNLTAYHADTGTSMWQRDDCHTPLTASSRTLLAMCNKDGIAVLDPFSGATLSRLGEQRAPDYLAAGAKYAVLAWRQPPAVRLGSPSIRLAFYRLADGSSVWEETETGGLFGLLTVDNNDVIYRMDNLVIGADWPAADWCGKLIYRIGPAATCCLPQTHC